MKLDSVRELKQALAGRVLSQIGNAISARSGAAMPMARTAEPLPSVALGVAPAASGEDFRLAVRVQRRAFQESREVELIIKQARGEVDVR